LKGRMEKENINNVYFLDAISKLEIPDLLEQMDVLYIGWENNPLYRFGISPNKLIDYMMAGKPILHSVNAVNDWVKESESGVSVLAESPEKIARGIEYIFSLDSKTLSEMGEKGKVFAQRNLNYSILANKIIDFLIQ
ncbi:MAG: glycosyltransferase WbuB, partial [Odoribacter sp.]